MAQTLLLNLTHTTLPAMERAEMTPPPLPRRPMPRALGSLGLLGGLVGVAWVARRFDLPLPGCPFREWTGVPCPFCGSTRAFAALAELNFIGAFRLNPLVSFATLVGGTVRGWGLLRGGNAMTRLMASTQTRRQWKWLLAGALLLNWIYLALHLPR